MDDTNGEEKITENSKDIKVSPMSTIVIRVAPTGQHQISESIRNEV